MTIKDHCYYLTRVIWDFNDPHDRHVYHQWMISHVGMPFKFLPEESCELLYELLVAKKETGHCPIHEKDNRVKRRAERIKTVGAWTTQRNLAIVRDNYTCQDCGKKPLVGQDLTVDHVLPLFMGGTSELGNLRTLCAKCHEKKHRVNGEDKAAWQQFKDSGQHEAQLERIRGWYEQKKLGVSP